MTSRELYEYALIELNKLEAPSLLLEDYNYFINKAVQQYINLTYAKLEADQQSTDDLRVLKATAILEPKDMSLNHPDQEVKALINGGLFSKSYYVDLPMDYLHMVTCIVEYTVQGNNFKCYNKNDKIYFAARRLTSDMYSQILNNAYLKPMYKRPYYFLNNINPSGVIVTNQAMDDEILTDDFSPSATPEKIAAYLSAKANYITAKAAYITAKAAYEEDPTNPTKEAAYEAAKATYIVAKSNMEEARSEVMEKGSKIDSENIIGDRLANPSTVRLELRFGNDDSVFKPTHLYIDYIKAPMYIRITQDQIDSTLDHSQVLEFPDYVCFEIVNIFTRLVMENASDPRLQTNMPINNTITNPTLQQQTQ